MRLEDIKRRRKNLGLGQAELAGLAGVSQSMIAKIEAGSLIPSYDKARAIFAVLNEAERQTGKKASDIMTRNVVTLDCDDEVSKATRLMKKHQLSCLPVMGVGSVIGLITERVIIENFGKKGFANYKVSKVMMDAPPIISEVSPVQMVSELLRYNPLILVAKGATISGVITKSDLLDLVNS